MNIAESRGHLFFVMARNFTKKRLSHTKWTRAIIIINFCLFMSILHSNGQAIAPFDYKSIFLISSNAEWNQEPWANQIVHVLIDKLERIVSFYHSLFVVYARKCVFRNEHFCSNIDWTWAKYLILATFAHTLDVVVVVLSPCSFLFVL